MADVIVVGGGIGGCGVAALLARKGFDVLLIEKNKTVGGRCTSIDRDGFRIPTYIHGFVRTDRGPCGELAREIGVPLHWVRAGAGVLNVMGQEFPWKGGRVLGSALKSFRFFGFSLRDVLGLVSMTMIDQRYRHSRGYREVGGQGRGTDRSRPDYGSGREKPAFYHFSH